MNSEVNLVAVIIASILALLMIFNILQGSRWKLRKNDKEVKLIRTMLFISMISCIIAPLVFYYDGNNGIVSYWIVYVGTMILFIAGIWIANLWVSMVSIHAGRGIERVHKFFLVALSAISGVILVVNFFQPIIFSVNQQNEYCREKLYLLYVIIDIIFLIDGLRVYVVAKARGGGLKFFPVVQITLPIITGVAIQTIWYGISIIWPCMVITISGILNSLKNETVFLDQLTGVYNRFYLDNIKKSIMRKKNGEITAMMIDMNDFKSINDRFGHATGDEALTIIAEILRDAVGTLGSIIRYAGDEFVILLNT